MAIQKPTSTAATISISFSDFESGLERYAAGVQEALVGGMAEACGQLMNDAIMVPPTVPIDEGYLRSTGSFFVNNILLGTSPDTLKPVGSRKLRKGMKPKPNTSDEEAVGDNEIIGVVGFNTPYAAYLHEGVRQDGTHKVTKWGEPGSGAKYLTSKMEKYNKQYMEIIAARLRRLAK